MEGYVFHMQANGLLPATIKNYLAVARKWRRWCEQVDLDPLKATRNDMLEWLGELKHCCADSTVRLHSLGLRVYYDYLVSGKLVKRNPARDIKINKQVARPVEPFSDIQLRRMLLACGSFTDRAIFYLLLGGGLRRNEVHGIRKEHINFDAGTIRIYGKGGKYRTIAPGTDAINALRLALDHEPELVRQADDDYIWRRVRRWGEKAGIEGRVFPHRFRYTFAVRFCQAGGGIDLLQTILGHSSLEMSMHYSRAGREERAIQAQATLNPASRLSMAVKEATA